MHGYVPWTLLSLGLIPLLPHSQADAEQERVQQLQRRLRREREEMWRLSHGGGESEAAAPLLLRTAEVCVKLHFLLNMLIFALEHNLINRTTYRHKFGC